MTSGSISMMDIRSSFERSRNIVPLLAMDTLSTFRFRLLKEQVRFRLKTSQFVIWVLNPDAMIGIYHRSDQILHRARAELVGSGTALAAATALT